MALVKAGNRHAIGEANASSNAAFDTIHNPGEECELEGIYKCVGCGKEITLAKGKTFPAQNHDQHTSDKGLIRWKLFVYAE